MKKLILVKILLLASLFSFSSYTMEKTGIGQVRKEADSSDSANPTKKSKTDPEKTLEEKTPTEFFQGIFNMNPEAMGTLLVSDLSKSLSADQKLQLYKLASNYADRIRQFAQQGAQLTTYTSDKQIAQEFSHQKHAEASKKIKELLQVFMNLKNLRFPQTLFSHKPYQNGPRISLDKALESLIMAEQKQISSCCFHLTLFNIAEALVAKKNEGISIELVTNQEQGNNSSLQALKHLVNNGVSVFSPKSRPWEANHHKFFIFSNNVLNKQLVWMGSYNPTGFSNENSWDDVMILDNVDVIQDYIERFNQVKFTSKVTTAQDLQNIRSNPSERALAQNNVPKELWK